MALQKAGLALKANVVEQDVARIAQQLIVLQTAPGHKVRPLMNSAASWRRSVFLDFGLALGQRLADLDGLALELLDGLGQLEVLVAAKFGGSAVGHRFA